MILCFAEFEIFQILAKTMDYSKAFCCINSLWCSRQGLWGGRLLSGADVFRGVSSQCESLCPTSSQLGVVNKLIKCSYRDGRKGSL